MILLYKTAGPDSHGASTEGFIINCSPERKRQNGFCLNINNGIVLYACAVLAGGGPVLDDIPCTFTFDDDDGEENSTVPRGHVYPHMELTVCYIQFSLLFSLLKDLLDLSFSSL